MLIAELIIAKVCPAVAGPDLLHFPWSSGRGLRVVLQKDKGKLCPKLDY